MQNITPTTLDLPSQVTTAINAVQGDLKLTLEKAFIATARQAQDWMTKAKSIVVQSETDTKLMADAKVFRLEIREVRLAAGKKHAELKAPINGYARAVDSCERMIRQACEPVEAYLMEQEEFVERKAARERQERALKRAEEMRAIGVDPSLYLTQAEQFTPEQWAEFIEGQKAAVEAKRAREKREAQESEDRRKEAERLRVENEQLRAKTAVLEVKAQDLSADLARQQRLSRMAAPVVVPTRTPRRSSSFFASDVSDAADYVQTMAASYPADSGFIEAVITDLRERAATKSRMAA